MTEDEATLVPCVVTESESLSIHRCVCDCHGGGRWRHFDVVRIVVEDKTDLVTILVFEVEELIVCGDTRQVESSLCRLCFRLHQTQFRWVLVCDHLDGCGAITTFGAVRSR